MILFAHLCLAWKRWMCTAMSRTRFAQELYWWELDDLVSGPIAHTRAACFSFALCYSATASFLSPISQRAKAEISQRRWFQANRIWPNYRDDNKNNGRELSLFRVARLFAADRPEGSPSGCLWHLSTGKRTIRINNCIQSRSLLYTIALSEEKEDVLISL